VLGSSNIFTSDPNVLAALTGRGSPNLVAPTYAASMTIDPSAGLFQQLVLTGNATLTPLNGGKPGQLLVLEIQASGGTRTATFASVFKSTATAAPTIGASILVAFMSDGTSFKEVCRTASAIS
jgi:hypothetical protein